LISRGDQGFPGAKTLGNQGFPGAKTLISRWEFNQFNLPVGNQTNSNFLENYKDSQKVMPY